MSDSPAIDLSAYLARIEYRGDLQVNHATLRALHEAHLAHIPFENLDIPLGRGIRLDLESVQAKLVRDKRGGYCFEQNALFAAALEAIGFPVTRLSARVRAGHTAVLPRTHMLLRVEADGKSWIADTGFGGWSPVEPIPLEPDVEFKQGAWTYRLHREGELTWVLQCLECPTGPDLYAFDLTPHLPIDYAPANHYTSTHPDSRFVSSVTAQCSGREVKYILRNRELITVHANGSHVEHVETNEQLREVLAHRFGLRLPPGVKFPQYE